VVRNRTSSASPTWLFPPFVDPLGLTKRADFWATPRVAGGAAEDEPDADGEIRRRTDSDGLEAGCDPAFSEVPKRILVGPVGFPDGGAGRTTAERKGGRTERGVGLISYERERPCTLLCTFGSPK